MVDEYIGYSRDDYGDEGDFEHKPERSVTTFLLDPRVLDDCVTSDSTPDVEIEGVGLGYISSKSARLPDYFFYQEGRILLPESLLKLPHTLQGSRTMKLLYQRANVYFVSPEDGWGRTPEPGSSRLEAFEVLYAHGQFLKGNEEAFKKYGIKIKKDEEENDFRLLA